MDVQSDTAGAPVGAAENETSLVDDTLALGRRVISGAGHDIEHLAERVIVGAESVVLGAESAVETTATSAMELIRSLGAVHVSIGKFDINAELSAAKAHVEDAIIALARHVGNALGG